MKRIVLKILIKNLKGENLEEFDDENVKLIENKGRLKKWVEKFFPTSDKHVGGDILRSYVILQDTWHKI